jgi:DNA mismatch repair protein MutS2
VSESILDEALELVGASSSKAESLLDSIYEMREKITSQEAGTRLALKQSEDERDRLRERLENIESERQQILEETKRQADSELEEVREEIRQVRRKLRDAESLNRLKKLQKETEEVEEDFVFALEPELIDEELKKPRKKPQDLRVGDTVLVTSLGAKGQIVSLDKHEAEVAVGRLHMRAELEELELKNREETEEVEQSAGRVNVQSPGMELDLRGQRVEEGLQILDQYLDEAFLSSLPWVRIIHGKGTGRLREAVRQALKANSHVQSWEEGRDGEGGAGVTVAKFVSD